MKIVCAESVSELADYMLTEIVSRAENNLKQNFLVVVPEKISVSVERLILEKSSGGALFNVQIVTLSRLLHKLNTKENNYLSKQDGIMIVKKIILDNLDKLVCYKKTAKTMGFSENVYDTISQLKNSNVSVRDYQAKRGVVTSSLSVKMQDIFFLFNEYEKYIDSNKLIDAGDRFALLTNIISSGDQLKDTIVYALGFDSITPSGLNVFEAILKSSQEVVFGCVDNSMKQNAYILPSEMLNNFKTIAKNVGQTPTVVCVKTKSKLVQQHLSSNVYAYPSYKREIENNIISLVECKNIEEEVEFVCENIRRRVIEDKIRYNEISVVVPNVQAYFRVVCDLFSKYQIPVFVDNPTKLVDNPLVQFVLGVLNTIKKHYSKDEFMAVLSNIYSNISVEDYSILDNYVVRYGVDYDKFLKPLSNKKNPTESDLNDIKIINDIQSRLVLNLQLVERQIKKSNSVQNYIEAIRDIFSIFRVEETSQKIMEKFEKDGELALMEETKQVKPKFEEILESMQAIFGNQEMPLDEFIQLLQSGLNGVTISLIPVTMDNVAVGELSTSKVFNVKDLYILGATDGAVPFSKDDCGIIVDKEIALLSNSIGKKIEPTIKTINMREKIKLINLLSEFKEKLFVLYPKLDFENEEKQPSSLIREISRIFVDANSKQPLKTITTQEFRKNCGKDATKFYFATKEVGTTRLLDEYSVENGLQDPMFVALFEYLTKENKKLNDFLTNPKQREKSFKSAKNLSLINGKTSISQIECYFACPFKYFANYGLKIKPREEAYLKPVDYGNVLHKVAEVYIRNIKQFVVENGKLHDSIKETEQKLNDLINQVFESEKVQNATNQHSVMLLKKEARVLIDALTFQYKNSKFVPKYQEIVFGDKGKIGPNELKNKIKVEGKIDRLDVYKDYFRVIDYKTGHIDLSPKTIYLGQKVQLFNYLSAVMKNSNLKPAGAFYLPIKNVFTKEEENLPFFNFRLQGYYFSDPEILKALDNNISPQNPKSWLVNMSVKSTKETRETGEILTNGNGAFSQKEIKLLCDYVDKICLTATNEIMEGYIEPRPLMVDGKDPCKNCDYRSACGRDFNSDNLVRKSDGKIEFESFVGDNKNE